MFHCSSAFIICECSPQLMPAVFFSLKSTDRADAEKPGWLSDKFWLRGLSQLAVCVTCTVTASATLPMLTACSCPLARFLTLLLRISTSLLLSSLYLTSKLSANTNQQNNTHKTVFLMFRRIFHITVYTK